jgi:hypothetical protein
MTRILTLLFATGCIGTRNVEPEWEYDDGEEVEVQEGCDEADVDTENGFRISGTVEDLETRLAPESVDGLCAYALNPTPVLSGGEPTVMAASQVCPGGEYVIGGLSDPPSIGMFVSIADCDAATTGDTGSSAGPTVMKSATGVDFDWVKDLGDGDIYEGKIAYLVTIEYGSKINADLSDFDGDAVDVGFMAGFALDADRQPVSGAALACGECADFYYLDTNHDDGMFMTDGVRNTVTDADADGIFVAPAAPIFTYEASDGGAHTWDPQLFGSLPGYASFLLFNAID